MDCQHATTFSAALLDPGLPGPEIVSRNPVDRERRFNIYRNNVFSSLIDALASTFPVVSALLGDEFFRAMAGVHVASSLPCSPALTTYGGDFPQFLRNFEPVAGLPYLADIAQLEFLRVQSHHAADAAALGAEQFHCLLNEPDRLASLQIELHPACHWLGAQSPVFSLWSAHQQAAPDLALIDLDIAQDVLIFRSNYDVQVLLLPEGGAAWLDALARGDNLAAATAKAATSASHLDVSRLLSVVIEHGLAVRLVSSPGD